MILEITDAQLSALARDVLAVAQKIYIDNYDPEKVGGFTVAPVGFPVNGIERPPALLMSEFFTGRDSGDTVAHLIHTGLRERAFEAFLLINEVFAARQFDDAVWVEAKNAADCVEYLSVAIYSRWQVLRIMQRISSGQLIGLPIEMKAREWGTLAETHTSSMH